MRSEVFHIDRIYRSMKGPFSLHEIRLEGDSPPQTLWITGYDVRVIGTDGEEVAPEFMCHSNLDLDVAAHAARFGRDPELRERLFTLSQGETEVRFPDGFGVPIRSDEPLRLYAQVLNLNEPDASLDVLQEVTIHYLREVDAPVGMKALFLRAANGYVLLDGDVGYFGVELPDLELHGPGCGVGMNAGDREFCDAQGRSFTGHWVVPRGRHEYTSLVTRFMDVPFDTTLHHVAVHLHPFAESVELVDRTAGVSVFKSHADNFEDRIGLRRVEELDSAAGVPVFADHEYELVTVYDNQSGVDQDSMSVMFLYLHDPTFDGPRTGWLDREPFRSIALLAGALYLLGGVWLSSRRRVASGIATG